MGESLPAEAIHPHCHDRGHKTLDTRHCILLCSTHFMLHTHNRRVLTLQNLLFCSKVSRSGHYCSLLTAFHELESPSGITVHPHPCIEVNGTALH